MGERGPGTECRLLGSTQGKKSKKRKKKRSVSGNSFYSSRGKKGGGIFIWDAIVCCVFPHLLFGTAGVMGQAGVLQLSLGLCHVQISTDQPGCQREVQIDK